VQNAWEGEIVTDLDNFKIRFISPETGLIKETLIKSNNFKLAKSACKFHEDRCNRMTVTTHFAKLTNIFFCP